MEGRTHLPFLFLGSVIMLIPFIGAEINGQF